MKVGWINGWLVSDGTDQLSVGRQSWEEVDKSDVMNSVWMSPLSGQFDETPDEDDVAQWDNVDDDHRHGQHDDR